ncbi:MAG: hypothetical protein ACPH4G_08940 [Henriciella sp.]
MKKFVGLCLLVATLSACGVSERDQVFNTCMEAGEATAAGCDCFADAAVESLDSEVISLIISLAENPDAFNAEFFDSLSPDQGVALMSFFMSVGSTCELDL